MSLFTCLKQTVYFVLPPFPVVEQAFSLKQLYNQKSYKQMAFKSVCMLSGTAIGLGWSLANANNMFNFFYEVGTGVDDAAAIVDKSPDAKVGAGTATTITMIWVTATGTRVGGLVADGVMAISNRLHECVKWPAFSFNANYHSQDVDRQANSQNLPLETIIPVVANSAKQEESQDDSKYYSVDNETEQSANYAEQSKSGTEVDENVISIPMPSAPASRLFGARNPTQINRINNANQSGQEQSHSTEDSVSFRASQ